MDNPTHLGAAAAAALVGGIHYLRSSKAHKPLVLCQATEDNLATVAALEEHLSEPLWPSWCATEGNAATMVGFTRLKPRFAWEERTVVPTQDGGCVGLDWFHNTPEPAGSNSGEDARRPVLIILHGLNGSSDDPYIRFLAHLATTKAAPRPTPVSTESSSSASPPFTPPHRWRVAAFLMRGCGGLPLTSRRGYSAADTDDLHEALKEVRCRFPNAFVAAAGYSLGANLLVKYLGEARREQEEEEEGEGAEEVGGDKKQREEKRGQQDGGREGEERREQQRQQPHRRHCQKKARVLPLLSAAASVSNPFTLRVDGKLHSHKSRYNNSNSSSSSSHDNNSRSNSQATAGRSGGSGNDGGGGGGGGIRRWVSGKVYSRLLAFKLRSFMLEHMHTLKLKGDWVEPAVRGISTLTDVDEGVVPRVLGLRDMRDYYETKASAFGVGNVRVPLLVLHGDDDPLIDPQDVPARSLIANPLVTLVRTAWGGHIGWGVGALPHLSTNWAEPLVLDFLAHKLNLAAAATTNNDDEDDEDWNHRQSTAAAAAVNGTGTIGSRHVRPPAQPHFAFFCSGGHPGGIGQVLRSRL